MIDYDKITEYMTTMGLNANGGFQLSTFAINEMLGNHYSISEKDLHDGVGWLKAKMKKEVEENPYWTTEHKEDVKNGQEYFLNCFEHEAKSYLKNQNRLL